MLQKDHPGNSLAVKSANRPMQTQREVFQKKYSNQSAD
jgi:hypothetical protein